MSRRSGKLLVLGGLTSNRNTLFKFFEPAGTPRDELFNRLLDGTYTKPFLVEEIEYRSMCFALDGCTQSEMRCHRYLPRTHLTAVEIDPDVLSLRSQFFVPEDDERLSVIHADGADHVAGMAERGEQTHVILVDAFDQAGIASAVVQRSFLDNAKRVLGAHGVFVMNLVAEVDDCKRHVATIRQAFGESVIVIAVQRGGNLVVFAGRSLHEPRRLTMALRNAQRVEERLGLFFPTLIQHLTELMDTLDFERTKSLFVGNPA